MYTLSMKKTFILSFRFLHFEVGFGLCQSEINLKIRCDQVIINSTHRLERVLTIVLSDSSFIFSRYLFICLSSNGPNKSSTNEISLIGMKLNENSVNDMSAQKSISGLVMKAPIIGSSISSWNWDRASHKNFISVVLKNELVVLMRAIIPNCMQEIVKNKLPREVNF